LGGEEVLFRHFYLERVAEEMWGGKWTMKFCNNVKKYSLYQFGPLSCVYIGEI
jgi:hypothetical protein